MILVQMPLLIENIDDSISIFYHSDISIKIKAANFEDFKDLAMLTLKYMTKVMKAFIIKAQKMSIPDNMIIWLAT